MLAERLTKIFDGDAGLYAEAQCETAVSAPLGTSLLTTANTYFVREEHSGKLFSGSSCYIYANAVYNALFGDVPYHGYSDTWEHSRLAAGFAESVSYESFLEWGVGFGSLLRSTPNGDGSYSGSAGHSVIILSYDRDSVTYLEGNGDGKGLVRIGSRTWDSFNSAMFWNRGYVLSFIVSPTETKETDENETQGWDLSPEPESGYIGRIRATGKYEDFSDVSQGSWYYPYVRESFETGLVTGCGGGRFCPGETLSCAQGAALVSRLLSGYWDDRYDFSGGEAWYSPYWDYLSLWGIAQSESPQSPMTRYEFAELVYKAVPKGELAAIRSGGFKDTDSAGITALYRAGIVDGYDGVFSGDSAITRAESAAILARVVNTAMRVR